MEKPVEPPFKPIRIAQPSAPHLNVRPPALTEERVVRPLPSAISDVAVGGGGRFLILHLPRDRKLAIFDVNEAKVVKYLSFTDDVKFAASMDKLLVALPDKKSLARYGLTTFECEATVLLAGEGQVLSLTLGSASNGPLLVQQGARPRWPSSLSFFDIASLKPLEVRWEADNQLGAIHRQHPTEHLRASANGALFALIDIAQPVTLTWEEGRVKPIHMRGIGHYALPGPDGKSVFTDRGIFTPDFQPTPGTPSVPRGMPMHSFRYPATHGPYSIADDSVYLLGEPRPIASLPAEKPQPLPDALPRGFDLPAGRSGGRPVFGGFPFDAPLTQDKRNLLIPDAKLFVLIPPSNDQIILTRLDIEAALEKSGIDYLFVTSTPPNTARPGALSAYRLEVRSKKGGVQSRLESGPPGMKLSAKGVLTWQVPADFAEPQADVLISVRDASGREVFHKFQIDCRK
jgi:hypothetical protein